MDIYKNFRLNADSFYKLNVKSRPQLLGNCFIKEPESAIQFAFATRNFSASKLAHLRHSSIEFKPKWEPSTAKIHQMYVEEQIKQHPHLKEQLKSKIDKYLASKLNRDILRATRKNDVSKVNRLIKKHIHESPTQTAILPINAIDASENTPLIWSVLNNNKKIAEKLIKNHANIDAPNRKDWSPLYISALNGNLDLIKSLLNAGAKNISSYELCEIAATAKVDLVKFFIASGVKTPSELLISASRGGNIELIKAFTSEPACPFDIDFREEEFGRTALINASISGHSNVVTELIKNSADISIKDNDGATALLWACQKGNDDIVKKLIEQGAEINMKDDFGVSPLIAAARKGNNRVVKTLLAAGVDINITDNAGMTALMWASSKGNKDLVKALIMKGADIALWSCMQPASVCSPNMHFQNQSKSLATTATNETSAHELIGNAINSCAFNAIYV